MSHRKEQVESTLQRAISEVLIRSMSDPRIEGMVSILRVHVSDDYKVADVYVSVLPEKFEKRSIAGLRAAAGHIHAKVFKAVAMRSVPRFVFQIDEAHKKEAAVFDAIASAMNREGLDPSQVAHNLNPVADEDEPELEDADSDDSQVIDSLPGDDVGDEEDDEPTGSEA